MVRVDDERLEAAATVLLEGLGTPTEVARQVAASLVGADLCGHGSHGIVRLPTMYADMVASDGIDPTATPSVTDSNGPTVRVDGNRAFGQLTGRVAVDRGADLAAEYGAAVVGVRNGTHLGRIGEWAERATDGGLILAAFVNTGLATRTVTIPGSAERLLSTNPIAVGIPTFDALPFPIVVDVATSQVAHGKVTARSVDGTTVPEFWTIDAEGRSVTDAEAFEAGEGALLPLGGRTAGHKGYGLAVASELLAGIVGGGDVFGEGSPGGVNNGAFFVLVDPLALSDRDRIERKVGAFADYLRDAERLESVPTPSAMHGDRPLLPGEPEREIADRRRTEGVPIGDRRIEALRELAAELGVAGRVELP